MFDDGGVSSLISQPQWVNAPQRVRGAQNQRNAGVPHARAENIFARAEEAQALKLLADYDRMQANWDGYGALAFDSETLRNSEKALSQLVQYAACPEIAPNPNGTVSFEWNSEHGSAHLEIGKTRFNFFVRGNGCAAHVEGGQASALPPKIGALVAAIVFPQVQSLTALTPIKFAVGNDRTRY